MAEERRSSGKSDNAALHASALDYAYRHAFAHGLDETTLWPLEQVREELRRLMAFEATLVVGLAPAPGLEDAGARLELLLRLEEVAGRYDGLTFTLMIGEA